MTESIPIPIAKRSREDQAIYLLEKFVAAVAEHEVTKESPVFTAALWFLSADDCGLVDSKQPADEYDCAHVWHRNPMGADYRIDGETGDTLFPVLCSSCPTKAEGRQNQGILKWPMWRGPVENIRPR